VNALSTKSNMTGLKKEAQGEERINNIKSDLSVLKLSTSFKYCSDPNYLRNSVDPSPAEARFN
jgi:hypothetical protein